MERAIQISARLLIANAERLARTDPRMEFAIIEESMTDEELSIARECDAQDQQEYSQPSNLPLLVKPWQITLNTQGEKHVFYI